MLYLIIHKKIVQIKDDDGKIFTIPPLNLQKPFGDIMSDYKKNGDILSFIPFRINTGSTSNNNNNPNQKVILCKVSCFVAITDKTYYFYNKSMSDGYGISNNNPFTEPVFIHSNINGGLGVLQDII